MVQGTLWLSLQASKKSRENEYSLSLTLTTDVTIMGHGKDDNVEQKQQLPIITIMIIIITLDFRRMTISSINQPFPLSGIAVATFTYFTKKQILLGCHMDAIVIPIMHATSVSPPFCRSPATILQHTGNGRHSDDSKILGTSCTSE